MTKSFLALAGVVLLVPLAHASPTDGVLPPTNVMAAYDSSAAAVRVSWSPPDAAQPYVYKVSRNHVLLATVSGSEYFDAFSSPFQEYEIQAVGTNGAESVPALITYSDLEAFQRGGTILQGVLKTVGPIPDVWAESNLDLCPPAGVQFVPTFPYLVYVIDITCATNLIP